ncbi:MAG: hypothetical protein K0R09_3581 [Clostridiales bacterium]|nr:hypothetical protein [Clostridiales bacterium]
MATERQKAIADLMNGTCRDRQFTGLEIAMIESSRVPELKERKKLNIIVNGKSPEGKLLINQRTANMVNSILRPKVPLRAEHIKIYKRCWADEYTDRTGKCAWGFKEICARLGYDPVTRLELN